jgi:hypothetical protein
MNWIKSTNPTIYLLFVNMVVWTEIPYPLRLFILLCPQKNGKGRQVAIGGITPRTNKVTVKSSMKVTSKC